MTRLVAYIRWHRVAFTKPNPADMGAVLQYVRAAEYDLYTGSRRA